MLRECQKRRVVNAITGELLRELTIDTSRDYQPRGKPQK
jgi:hypothetical protein